MTHLLRAMKESPRWFNGISANLEGRIRLEEPNVETAFCLPRSFLRFFRPLREVIQPCYGRAIN